MAQMTDYDRQLAMQKAIEAQLISQRSGQSWYGVSGSRNITPNEINLQLLNLGMGPLAAPAPANVGRSFAAPPVAASYGGGQGAGGSIASQMSANDAARAQRQASNQAGIQQQQQQQIGQQQNLQSQWLAYQQQLMQQQQFASLAAAYQSKVDAANKANEDRYNEAKQGRTDLRERDLQALSNWGNSQITDAKFRSDQTLQAGEADLRRRGLGSSTINTGLATSANESLGRELGTINDQIINRRVNTDTNLSDQLYSMIERKNDVAPDVNQFMMLAKGMGQFGTAGAMGTPGLTGSPGTTGLSAGMFGAPQSPISFPGLANGQTPPGAKLMLNGAAGTGAFTGGSAPGFDRNAYMQANPFIAYGGGGYGPGQGGFTPGPSQQPGYAGANGNNWMGQHLMSSPNPAPMPAPVGGGYAPARPAAVGGSFVSPQFAGGAYGNPMAQMQALQAGMIGNVRRPTYTYSGPQPTAGYDPNLGGAKSGTWMNNYGYGQRYIPY